MDILNAKISTAKNTFLTKLATLTILLLFSLVANASLVSMDWKSAGDGALTYDDQSGLWWLDLTETAGMSYSQVSAQLSTGGSLEGWRYATITEARDIYAQFGLTAGADTALPIEDFRAAIATMNSYLGDLMALTSVADTNSGNWAISGTEWDVSYPDWHIMIEAYTYGGGESALLDLGGYAADLDMSWEYAGSLLVTDENPASVVPLPAALVLFPAGMFVFGLAGVRRRE
jgi:hypothetical protein